MRKTRFRGLNAKGQWEYGYVVREQFCGYDEVLYPECNNDEFLTYEKVDGDVLGADSTIVSYGYKIHRDGGQSSVWVKRDTIGQSAALKDKRDVEIYEGDIVKNHWWGDGEVGFLGEEWIVKFGKHESNGNDVYTRNAYGWYYESKGETYSLTNLPQTKGIEIVGNIYELPIASESPPAP